VIKSLAKQHLPPTILDAGRTLRHFLQRKALGVLVRSELLAALHCAVGSPGMRCENKAVLNGRLRYMGSHGDVGEPMYRLRRNVHRLEKGLLMRPMRHVFAVAYIEETVLCYEKVLQGRPPTRDSTVVLWAHDVLAHYFDLVGSAPAVEVARAHFQGLPRPRGDERERVPYSAKTRVTSPVTFEDLLLLAQRRKSIRWYAQEPVDRALIDKAVALASLAPSSCNRQPVEFYVLDDARWVHKVLALAHGAKGFSENAPVAVVLVGQLRAYSGEDDRHLVYIDGALAAMAFMYALETLGLGSCPIKWPDTWHLNRQVSQLLHLEADERVIMLMSVGHPDPEGMVACSQRKGLPALRRHFPQQGD